MTDTGRPEKENRKEEKEKKQRKQKTAKNVIMFTGKIKIHSFITHSLKLTTVKAIK